MELARLNQIRANFQKTLKMTNSQIEQFCSAISYHFKNSELLDEALTHPSLTKAYFLNQNGEGKKVDGAKANKVKNYQRLEFLGDKVLGLIIGEFLMQKYPNEDEGLLSRRQSGLVSGDTLAKIALKIGLDKVLRLSFGEKNLGGGSNKRNLENALEALIGAIYFDSGFDAAKKFIYEFWQEFLEKNMSAPKDPVSQLQELVQLKFKELPKYSFEKIGGTDHSPLFLSKLKVPNFDEEFSATGGSKKEAQKLVSKEALKKIYHL